MPYLNPLEVPSADIAEFCSVCVCFPDYPEYRAALLGSLNFLATWTAWERDSAHTASKSAELWKVANEATKECWDMPCGSSNLPPVINVTVNNTCGTGGGSTNLYCVNEDGDTIVNPPPVTDYPTEPTLPLPPDMEEPPVITPDIGEPPSGFDTWEDYNQSACIAANTLWQWAMDGLLFVRELLSERIFQVTTVFALVVNFMLGGIGLVMSSAMLLKLAELYARLYAFLDPFIEAVDAAIADLETNKEEYICWMYTHRGNVGEWETDLITKLFNASSGGLTANTSQPLWRDLLSFLIPVYTAIDTLYGSVSYVGDTSGYISCANCIEEGLFDVTFDFTDDTDGWAVGSRSGWSSGVKLWQNPRVSLGNSVVTLSVGTLSTLAGFDATVLTQPKLYIRNIDVMYSRPNTSAKTFVADFVDVDNAVQESTDNTTGELVLNMWNVGEIQVKPWVSTGEGIIFLHGMHNNTDVSTDEHYSKSVRIRGRFEVAA